MVGGAISQGAGDLHGLKTDPDVLGAALTYGTRQIRCGPDDVERRLRRPVSTGCACEPAPNVGEVRMPAITSPTRAWRRDEDGMADLL